MITFYFALKFFIKLSAKLSICSSSEINVDETTFRRLVVRVEKTVLKLSFDKNQLIKHFDLPTKPEELSSYIIERICEKLNTSNGLTCWDLRQLSGQFLLRHLIDGEELKPYFHVIDYIERVVRKCQAIKEYSDSKAWEEAIKL